MPDEYLCKGVRRSNYASGSLRELLSEHLDVPETFIDRVEVVREAIDARRKPRIEYVYNLRFTLAHSGPRASELQKRGMVSPYAPKPLPEPTPRFSLPERPIIVGFGPAGMFLGLQLLRMGYSPIIFERGLRVPERVESVDALWGSGILDPESNLQFGEGGAGTFSDGKLSTGKRSPLDRVILETFVEWGAPESILCSHRPHIGTDRLRRVVVAARKRILDLGGEIHFGQEVTDLQVDGDGVAAITVSGQRQRTRCVVLAIGHSARDTVRVLHGRGVRMEPKSFAIGTRIEHPASLIDEAQYGTKGAQVLPAADYRLSYRHRGLAVYSFCMCPGGHVVCASSEQGGQVSNGMSRYARDSGYSNSALVVGVDPGYLGLGSPLDAIAYQRGLERRAYEAGGGGFVAPAQMALDFVRGRQSHKVPDTTYRPGVAVARIDEVLPGHIVEALAGGLSRFDRTIPGFVDQGTLIGVETRTSSPVRLLRDENCQSVSTLGLYLLGEGAGYAGGIMTCARDALRFARLVVPRC